MGKIDSFVFDEPIFKNPISFKKGEIVLRDERLYFCDIMPV